MNADRDAYFRPGDSESENLNRMRRLQDEARHAHERFVQETREFHQRIARYPHPNYCGCVKCMPVALVSVFLPKVRPNDHGSAENPCFCAECLTIGQHHADRERQRKLDEL